MADGKEAGLKGRGRQVDALFQEAGKDFLEGLRIALHHLGVKRLRELEKLCYTIGVQSSTEAQEAAKVASF